MGAPRLNTETKYLRGFAKSYFAETAFTPDAEREMREQRVSLIDVHQALRACSVVESEKEEAEGAKWTVVGSNADDERFWLWLDVYCNHCRVTVLSVKRYIK